MKAFFAATLFALLLLPAANAAESPRPGPSDPRIRVVRYDPNEVVELVGTLGYAMSIEFGDGEKIENVSIGDAQGWQVTPNRRANLLFVKPMRRDAVTNMAVYTNLRRYMFDLSVGPDQSPRTRRIIFGLRFLYPEAAQAIVAAESGPPKPALPSDVNHAYSYDGSAKNLPPASSTTAMSPISPSRSRATIPPSSCSKPTTRNRSSMSPAATAIWWSTASHAASCSGGATRPRASSMTASRKKGPGR